LTDRPLAQTRPALKKRGRATQLGELFTWFGKKSKRAEAFPARTHPLSIAQVIGAAQVNVRLRRLGTSKKRMIKREKERHFLGKPSKATI
jgi:hypothetical protein